MSSMYERGKNLKVWQKAYGLTDREVEKGCAEDDISIDSIRKLGRIAMSEELLDSIEQGIERARMTRVSRLQPRMAVS